MNVRYDGEEDILLIEISKEPIDYAEEAGPVIVHFTREGKPVLIEILDATEFWGEVRERMGQGART